MFTSEPKPMRNLTTLAALTAATLTATAGAQSITNVELGLTGGYAGGLSGEAFIHAPNIVGPIGLKFGVAYTNPSDAINDSSDLGFGTFGNAKKPISQGGLGATEYGSHLIVGLDGTYGLGELAPGIDATLYAGGRYGMFKSTEDYGGGVSSDWTSNSFGIGAGAMLGYALTGNISLVGDLGVDYFFKSPITQTQHTATGATQTTTYGTSDSFYATADNRFVRPGTVFKARIGVKFTF